MSSLVRWFTLRSRIPASDEDIEAQHTAPAQVQTIELSRPSIREEDGMVIVDQQSTSGSSTSGSASLSPLSSASNNGQNPTGAAVGVIDDADHAAMVIVNSRITFLKKTSQLLIVLTVLQIMSTLGTEHIHFLSLFSLFVPWCGYEGSKERNFAYLRAFYWGCWIMIPANLFHYLSFEQFVDEVMASNLEDNLRRELVFNHTLFNVVTIAIILFMTLCLVWVRQLSIVMRSLRHFSDGDFLTDSSRSRDGPRVPTGPLTDEEISAIPAIKLIPEDISAESADKDVCVICQDEFQANDLVKRLTCRHMFHAHCIDAWLQRSSACPICNGDVRAIV